MTEQQKDDKTNTQSTVERRIAEDKRKFLIAFVKHKGIVKYTCAEVGINRSTYYDWRKNDVEFAQGCADAEEDAIDHVENKLHELIDDKDSIAVRFFMRCKGRSRGYVERTEIAPVDTQGNTLFIPTINVSVQYPEGWTPPAHQAGKKPEIKIVPEDDETSTRS